MCKLKRIDAPKEKGSKISERQVRQLQQPGEK